MPKTKTKKLKKFVKGESTVGSSLVIEEVRQLLDEAEHRIKSARQILFTNFYQEKAQILKIKEGGRVMEGVFDGENIVTSTGKKYPVPPNYASKSRLVSGDLLKLTIGVDGTFIFKQIGPVPRKKVIGVLEIEGEEYWAVAAKKRYRILPASATYFRAKAEDKLSLIVPKNISAEWAALENVLPK